MLLCYIHDHITFQEPIQKRYKENTLCFFDLFIAREFWIIRFYLSSGTHHIIDQQDRERTLYQSISDVMFL